MTHDGMSIKLSWDEALVLFGWLDRTERATGDYAGLVEDDAERVVLWDIYCELERQLAAPFTPAYEEQLGRARARVRGEPPRGALGD